VAKPEVAEAELAAYDSRPDTRAHIARVQELLKQVRVELAERAVRHDKSKLVEPELSAFDHATPLLAAAKYGTPEYDEAKAALGPALEAHYRANDHHPEHFPRGIEDMDLIQLIEMLADWKAAGERHEDGGDLHRSIIVNQERFGYDQVMATRLYWTARRLGWIEDADPIVEPADA
jgi:hypothetical protein